MNLLKSPLLSVRSLLTRTGAGGAFGGKPVKGSASQAGCIYSNYGADGHPSPSSSRSYGTLRALLHHTATMSGSLGGALPSMTSSSSLSRPLLWNSDLAGNSQITPGSFYIQSRGMKYKGKVKRRCKDCYLMWINGMLYNLCKTHPRHKHGLQPAYFANQRILTHATNCPKRPW